MCGINLFYDIQFQKSHVIFGLLPRVSTSEEEIILKHGLPQRGMGREDEMALIYLRINTINNKKREIQHVESNMCVTT